MGTLYYGDNLDILRRYLPAESVDLVYLDPPVLTAPTDVVAKMRRFVEGETTN